MVSLESLNRVEIFKDLDRFQLAPIQELCSEVTFKAGEKLFTEGDKATDLWIVVEGHVDLRFELPGDRPASSETTISRTRAQKEESKTLGWSCFVPPNKMRLSAYCVTDSCRIIKIPKDGLVKVFEKDPRTGYLVMLYMAGVIGFRFQQFQDEVAKNIGDDLIDGW